MPGSDSSQPDPYMLEPDPNNKLHQYEEEIAASDYLYRFLYLQHKRQNVFLRYYYMLSLAFKYFARLAAIFQSDASPDFLEELHGVTAPDEMSYPDFRGFCEMHPDEIETALSRYLTDICPRPPKAAKRDAEDVFYFTCLIRVPDYLRLFRDDSPIEHFRLRDPNLVFMFLCGTERPSVRMLVDDMLCGSKTPNNLLGKPNDEIVPASRSGGKPNLHVAHVTVATVAAFIRIWYMCWMPFLRTPEEKRQVEYANEDEDDQEIRTVLRPPDVPRPDFE